MSKIKINEIQSFDEPNVKILDPLESTVLDGTPPLVVTSKEMVNNLNVEKLGGYDASQFNPIGLLVKRNATTPNTKIDITFTAINVQGLNATPGTYIVDQTISGVLGLDTGLVAESTWYYFFIIMKEDGTTSAIMSTSSTTPTLPTGYTRYRFVTCAYTAVTTKYFVDFVQNTEVWSYITPISMWSASAVITADINCSQWIPEKTKEISITYSVSGTYISTASSYILRISGKINGVFTQQADTTAYSSSAGVADAAIGNNLIVSENRHIYVNLSTPAASTINAAVLVQWFKLILN